MRFIKRLSAIALAIVITVSSIKIPGGTSYAAEPADGIANGQDVTISPVEETEEDTGMTEGESQPDEGTVTDGGSQTDDEDAALGDDSQPGDDNAAGDDSQPGDDNAASDDDRPDHESVSEEETDAGQVSGNDAGEPDQSVDTEETEAEEIEIVEVEIEGAYQFGDAPSAGGEMSVFSISTYDESGEDYVYQQMLQRVERIDLYAGGFDSLSARDAASLMNGVINEHPDLYFVKQSYYYDYGPDFKTVRHVYMTYSTDYDDVAFEKKTEAALACVTDDMSDDMKAAVLHDYLVINVEYDYDNYQSGTIPKDSYNAYGALVNGVAVCEGYALAYKYLLNQAGIECYMVTSQSMNHAWNLMKLDGEYYHVDTTWDDPVWDMVGRVYHDNLFRSDTNFGEHRDWTVTSGSSAVDYKATDPKYENAFWTDCTSPLVFDGTDCYYISKTGMSLKKTSFSNINATGTEVISVGRWMSGSGGYWVGAYSGLYRMNGRLFYNDGNSIYSIRPDGTDRKTEFTPKKTGSTQIYYSAYRNGQVVYALQTSPNLSEKQTVLIAEIDGIERTYNITYVLDGGTNDKDNPIAYTAGTKTIVLKDAAKEGYKFEGWYKDSAYTQKVTEIPEGSTGDIMLYAKWSKAALNALNKDYTLTTLDDETVSTRAEGKPKVLFFFKMNSLDCAQTNQDLSEHIEVFGGVDIYAIEYYDGSTKEEVAEYKNTYGCDGITYCYDKERTNYNCFWDYFYNITRINDGSYYQAPLIVFIDSNNRVQFATDGARSWTDILTDLQKYCGYDYEDIEGIYNITYVLDGGTNDKDNPSMYMAGTKAIVLKDAAREGYKFEGWYQDAAYQQKVTEIPEGSTGDITLYAKWTEIKEVENGLNAENLNYTFTTLDDETVSSMADGKPKVLFFFKPDCYYCQKTSQDLSQHINNFSGVDIYVIEAFNSCTKDEVADFKKTYGCDEITYCYDKDGMSKYYVWDYVDLTHVGGNSVTTPVLIFIDSQNRVQYGTAGRRSWDQILSDLQEYCGYGDEDTEETYKITYELNGGMNDSENPDTYTSETETITLKDPSKEGFIFEGWYTDARFNRKVTEIVKGSVGDITLYAKWKAAEIVIDPDQPESIRTGIYVRFTDYYRLGENSRPCYKYTGAAVKPVVEVYNNGTLLTLGTDYTLAYKNNTKVGAASLSVKGKGNFSGASNAVSFEIINADIRTDTDHPLRMTVIAGTKVSPLIMNGTKKLTTKDYKLEGDNLVGGKYAQPTGVTPNTLTVTGIGSYAGSSFTIAVTVIDKKDAKKLAVTVDKNFKPVYSDKAIDLDALFCSPDNAGSSIKVTDAKDKNTVLENGKDYSVLCTSSLRDAGTVSFTVTGMGEYTGSVSKSFKISPLKVTDNSSFEVSFDNREYEYKVSGATVDNLKVTYLGATSSADDDIVLTQGTHYKVSYANNKKVSTEVKKAQVKVTFLGNYKGSKPVSKNFTVAAARMSMTAADAQAANTKVIVPDKVYDKAGKSYKSTPIVMVDGAGIKASNYTVSYAWAAVTYAGMEGSYAEGNKVRLEEADSHAKVKVTITLKGPNYALADGTAAIEGEYCVRRKTGEVTDLSGAKVTFRDKDGNQLKSLEYNGRAYYTPEGNNPEGSSVQADPNAVYVSVTVNGKPVDAGLYDVVWTNATAKGKATVVVTGKGTGAVGSRSQTISIKAMALKGRDIAYFMVNMANSLKNIL